MSDLKWGSPEWKTHLRRSLAQRKRHGENIRDIEELISYIQEKGPGHAHPQLAQKTKKKQTRKQQSKARTGKREKITSTSASTSPMETQAGELGLYKAPTVLRVGG